MTMRESITRREEEEAEKERDRERLRPRDRDKQKRKHGDLDTFQKLNAKRFCA